MKLLCVRMFIVMLVMPGVAYPGALRDLAEKLGKDIRSDGLKIAVMDFSASRSNRDSLIVRERITTYLAQNRNIMLVERSLLEKVFQEQKMQLSGVVEAEEGRRIGKLAGANAIVSGTLSELKDGEFELNARIIDVETGEVLSAGMAVFKKDWKDIESFNAGNGVPYEFKISDLPSIPSATVPAQESVVVPRAQMPDSLPPKGPVSGFESVDVDALEEYNDVVKYDKSDAPPYEKSVRWKKLGEKVMAYKRTADARAREWFEFSESVAVDDALSVDKSTLPVYVKISKWEQISDRYPGMREEAGKRVFQWKRYSTELNAIALAKARRLILAKKDQDKLKRLLGLSVVTEQDKQRFVMAFADAYGKDCLENPYLLGVSAYLPKKYLGRNDREKINSLERQTVVDPETGLMWVKDGKSAGCNNGQKVSWSGAVDFCADLTYAGYSDWRLPSRDEVIPPGKNVYEVGYSVNASSFPHARSGDYWITKNSEPWTMSYGNSWPSNTRFVGQGENYVRCVRDIIDRTLLGKAIDNSGPAKVRASP